MRPHRAEVLYELAEIFASGVKIIQPAVFRGRNGAAPRQG